MIFWGRSWPRARTKQTDFKESLLRKALGAAGCAWLVGDWGGSNPKVRIVEKSGPFEMMRFTLQTSAEMGLDHFFGVLAQDGQKGHNF